MNISYKDMVFIKEALLKLLKEHEERLCHVIDEDIRSDIGNDINYLLCLIKEFEEEINDI